MTGQADELVVTGLSAGYGAMRIVTDISLSVAPGEIVAIVGRNGAGKTTAVSAIAGLRYGGFAGSVTFDGQRLEHAAPARILRAGVALVPSGHRLFPSLTVTENLRLGAFHRRKEGGRPLRDGIEHIFGMFPVLRKLASTTAGQLSGGEQQMVSIGQALMAEPKMLILDEPTSALAPVVGDVIYAALASLKAESRGILLVEQDIYRALHGADRCYVLDNGKIQLSGAAESFRNDDRIQQIVIGNSPL
jgi:branched-chain amino acid transport system ATP-binding protein